MFGGVGIAVVFALFYGAAWLTWQLEGYEELGDYLLRLGLSWIFMTFLAFLDLQRDRHGAVDVLPL